MILLQLSAGVHVIISIVIVVLLVFSYTNIESDVGNSFDLKITLNAVVSAAAIANVFIGIHATYTAVEQDNTKNKLDTPFFNIFRNFMTSLVLVFIGILLGFDSNRIEYVWAFIGCIILRFIDVYLDTGDGIWKAVCLDGERVGLGSFKMTMLDWRKTFVTTMFLAIFLLLGFDAIVVDGELVAADTSGTLTTSGILILLIFIFTGVHLLLLVLNILGNSKLTGDSFKYILTCGEKQEYRCYDDMKVITWNQIPWVSKLVFTVNLCCISYLIGNRIHENLQIELLVYVAFAFGAADNFGRNLL